MTHPLLNPRSESVLRTLIEAYLLEGEPVGSRLISQRFPQPVSSATIRNVLMDLEDDALVAQPHTSAGRVPTERAYRYYVDRWVRPARTGLDSDLGAQLASSFQGMEEGPEVWLRHASRVLSEVMGGICVALPVHLGGCRLVRLDFVPLEAHRLVAIWVGTGGEVEHQTMENPWHFDASTLAELSNFATLHFAGCTLEELQGRLLETLQSQADAARMIVERLMKLATRMERPGNRPEPGIVISGLGGLGREPEFEDSKAFRELVLAFEEHERLARLLNAFAQSAAEEVKLLLGSENPFLSEMPLATAMRTVSLPFKGSVTFALVGPLRLDYQKVVGGLAWWSGEVQRRAPRSA